MDVGLADAEEAFARGMLRILAERNFTNLVPLATADLAGEVPHDLSTHGAPCNGGYSWLKEKERLFFFLSFLDPLSFFFLFLPISVERDWVDLRRRKT